MWFSFLGCRFPPAEADEEEEEEDWAQPKLLDSEWT